MAYTSLNGLAAKDPSIIVTGEANILYLSNASVLARILGRIIDLIVYSAMLYGLYIADGYIFPDASSGFSMALSLSTFLAATLLVPTAVESLTRGKSVGKLVCGTRVVRDDGGAIRFRHAFIRNLLLIIELSLTSGMLSLVFIAMTKRNKRFGDALAGTFVMQDRVHKRVKILPVSPAQELQDWASRSDIAVLNEQFVYEMRSFLSRQKTMDPNIRAQIISNYLDHVLTRVTPQPPAGHDAVSVLVAVVEERKHRDVARLEQRKKKRQDRNQGLSVYSYGIERASSENV